MLTAFPTPVLSVAADAVKDLEGRDALSGLWTLFTKCKESLQDGRRLENISWRLWYREMMRDGLTNRLQENENEKEKLDHPLGPLRPHTPTNLYLPPTPSEPTHPPPPYVAQDANGLNDLTLSDRPTVLPQDLDHATSSPTSRLGPTQVNIFRSNSPTAPALCPPLDSASASLQMSNSNSNSDTALLPVVSVHPFSLSSSPSGSKSRDFVDAPSLASSIQSTRRGLSGFQAQIQCHAWSNTPTPVYVGRIIYDMLLCSVSDEMSRSGLKVWPSSMTATTWKLTSAESIPTPVVDPSSSLQHPAMTPTFSVGLPNSIALASATTFNAGTTNTKYTSLHTAPPSPSLSDSYARAHPEEVETRLEVDVGLGPSLSVLEPSPSSPQILGNAHIVGASPNLQVPPRLVVVNPTPNLTPHPTPPASPLSASPSPFSSTSSASTSRSNNHNGFGGTKGNWLTLPPNHYPNRIQDPQTHDRSRSNSAPTTAVTATDVSSSSFSLLQLSQPPSDHQSVGENQLAFSQSFVQDLEISASSDSKRHSISSMTTIASATDSTTSVAISTATAATSVSVDGTSEVEEPRKTINDGDMWINDAPVGSPVVDVNAQPMSKAGGSGPPMRLRLDSLSTIHSVSVRKGGDEDEDSAADAEEQDGTTRLMNATTTTAAAVTKKKKVGVRKKVKTKTLPLKRNSPISTLSQLARQDADVREAELRKQQPQRLHEQRQEQGVQRETNGLPGVSVKLPVKFNIESNSDDGSGVGSNSKNGSEVSGTEPPIGTIVNGTRQPHQLGIIQQQHAAAPLPHPAPHHQQQLKSEKQLEHRIIREGEVVAGRQLQKEEKGKRREHSNPNTNTKHSTHETLNMVSSALAAKVKHTLADPLLPGQHKRTIVLTTSESEYEHSDDDGSCWSSEEMGSEDEDEGRRQERQKQDRLLTQQQQQQRQELKQRPSPMQRTHSSNHALPANHNHNHTRAANNAQRTQSSRGHRHPPNHAQGQALTQAAQEAQRQLDMFAKKPTESFQNLTQVARTQSVGLLTQLLNPDPEIFPVGHPYRRGYSSSEVRGVVGRPSASRGDKDQDRGFRPLQPLMDVKATKTDDNKLDKRPPPSRPEAALHRKSSSSAIRATAALSPPARTLSMQQTKSTVAMPVSSHVQTGSVSHTIEGSGHGAVNGFGITNVQMIVDSNRSPSGYRPKGRPQDQELEDESGSEAEFGIQVSKSVAQEKLKALAEKRGIVAYANQSTATTNGDGADTNQKKQLGDENDVPHWAKVSRPQAPTRTRSHDQYPQSQAPDPNANRRSLNAFHLSHPTPIPVGHPYNLPPPAPPSTPRTTRRLMLSTELSESLRRNLLWERQLSKVNLAAGVRRTASTGGSRHSHLGGVQPLTTAPSMVQLLPKGTLAHPNPGSPVRSVRPEQEGSKGDGGIMKERRASGGAGDHPDPSTHDENEKEQKRRLAMARNRSWANDYHFAGW